MIIARSSRKCSRRQGAFTLIEIMIVISIVAIIAAAGIPSALKALQRDEMAKAVRDIIEGCKLARDKAILQATPFEFSVSSEGALNVSKAQLRQREVDFTKPERIERPNPEGGEQPETRRPVPSPYDNFPRQLGEDVIIQLIDVNFIDHMKAPEARVRFFPNGTCDEFTIVLMYKGVQRHIKTDVVTGMAEEVIK